MLTIGKALELFDEAEDENYNRLMETKEAKPEATIKEAYEYFKGLGGSVTGLIDEVNFESEYFSEVLKEIYGHDIMQSLLNK